MIPVRLNCSELSELDTLKSLTSNHDLIFWLKNDSVPQLKRESDCTYNSIRHIWTFLTNHMIPSLTKPDDQKGCIGTVMLTINQLSTFLWITLILKMPMSDINENAFLNTCSTHVKLPEGSGTLVRWRVWNQILFILLYHYEFDEYIRYYTFKTDYIYAYTYIHLHTVIIL